MVKYSEIMVRYGELSTKGKNRKAFVGRLNGNVAKALHEFENLRIHPKRDRMHIILNGDDAEAVMEKLHAVFGIQNYSPSIKVDKDIEEVKRVALELMQETVGDDAVTFKVNTQRSDHGYYLDTNEMNYLMGDFITDEMPNLIVQMKKPDVTLRVEIRKDAIYLSNRTIDGAGGLPVGTAGKAMLMLSGGIDSPVAGYLALKRGVDIEMVHFFSPPYTSENALKKAKDLTAKLVPYVGSINFIEVPFTEIQEEIKNKVPEGYLMTIQRRMMLRLTDAIREQREGLAIVNGEAVGQVASQTLESMLAINEVTTTPIIRPVATMDKNDIIKIAKDIDTYDLSIMPFEDCCTIFAPPAPKTRPSLTKTLYYEQRIDVEGLMQRSLDNIKISTVKANDHFLNEEHEIIAELL